MKIKVSVIIFFVVVLAGSLLYYVSIHPTKNTKVSLIKSESVLPSSPPSPTPTPIVIDPNSNLQTEAEKLNPSDFSPDFEKLKTEVNSF